MPNTETVKVQVSASRNSGESVSQTYSITIAEDAPITEAIDRAIERFRNRFPDADDLFADLV